MTERLIVNILLLFSILYLPWWLSLAVAVGASFWFFRYYELIAVGLLIDLLYGQGATYFFPFIVTTGTIVLYITIAFLKTKLRWYE